MDDPTVPLSRYDTLNASDYDGLEHKIDQLYALARDMRLRCLDARARGEPIDEVMLGLCRRLEDIIDRYRAAGNAVQ